MRSVSLLSPPFPHLALSRARSLSLSPMEKGCFLGSDARMAFCEDERITSPGVLKTAPNMPARKPPWVRQQTSAWD